MIITLTGDLGSGKSTVAKLLSEKLRYKFYSTGSIFRKIAQEEGFSLEEFTKKAETDPGIDQKIDDYQVSIGKTEDGFVLEGRLGFHFIPGSVKVCLRVSGDEAARRIMNDHRVDEKYDSLEEAKEHIEMRRKSEEERYKRLYNIDLEDDSQFDLVINTTKLSIGKVTEKIIKYIEKIKK
ncbi:Putative adenylate kinase [Candidatus Tiddalikarchaeum anstoanum]|nr:Putative adenylate kinase [Candidatus Tiddalikarchaeum anstoanum]